MEARLPRLRLEFAQCPQKRGQGSPQAEIFRLSKTLFSHKSTLFTTIHKLQPSRSAIQWKCGVSACINSRKRGGLLPHPPAPYTEGEADATRTARLLALVSRRAAAATKALATGLFAVCVWTCPPVPSLVRLGTGKPTCWANRGLPV